MSEKTKKVKYKLLGLFFMSAFNDQTLLLKYKAFYNICVHRIFLQNGYLMGRTLLIK